MAGSIAPSFRALRFQISLGSVTDFPQYSATSVVDEKGGAMKASEMLELVSCVSRLIFLLLEVEIARRNDDGQSDTS